jgi:trigger factor
MPNVVREDKDALNAVVTVTLQKKDYEGSFQQELKKYQQGASMKGFRKGKTPISVVKKMFGKSVLADIINRSFQQELDNFIREEDIQLLGSPLPAEDQELLDFDLKNLDDFVLKFDLGLAPAFELKGLDNETPLTKWVPDVTDEMVDEDFQNLRRRAGKSEPTEEAIEEGDIVQLKGAELDGEELKEDGLEAEFSISTQSLSADFKKFILGKKAGEEFTYNLTLLEENGTEEFVRNYYLKLDKDDDREVNYNFRLTIEEVNRISLAELNQEFFDSSFGEGKVTSEEEAKEKMREAIAGNFVRQSEGLLYRDMQDHLMEQNPLEFPREFLIRWLATSQEGMTPQKAEAEFPQFAKGLQWTLIQEKIIEKFELEVTEPMIREKIKDQVRGYFGGQADDAILESMADRLIQDPEQVRRIANEAMSDLVFETLEKEMQVEEVKLSMEDFNAKVAEAQASAAGATEVEIGEEE